MPQTIGIGKGKNSDAGQRHHPGFRIHQLQTRALQPSQRFQILNRRKMGFGVVAFTQVSFSSHDMALTNEFEQIVNALEWVQMCHCITGSVDYILQMVFRDLDEFSDRINIIRRIPGVSAIQTSISVKEIKAGSGLPIGV